MAILGDLLFFKGMNSPSLDNVLSHQITKALPDYVEKVSAKKLSELGVEEVVDQIVGDLLVEPIKLHVEEGKSEIKEISIEGTNHWGERYKAPGLKILKSFPFDGDPELWKVYAGSFSMNPPRGIVRGQQVSIGMETQSEQKNSAVEHIKSTLAEIQKYIGQQAEPIENYNSSLKARVSEAVENRKSQLDEIDDFKKSLDEI